MRESGSCFWSARPRALADKDTKDKKMAPKFQTIDEYIASFPKDVQDILEKVRETIKEAAPEAQETISYQMPTFMLDGRYLVYFAAWKKHIGFYTMPVEAFEEEVSSYLGPK